MTLKINGLRIIGREITVDYTNSGTPTPATPTPVPTPEPATPTPVPTPVPGPAPGPGPSSDGKCICGDKTKACGTDTSRCALPQIQTKDPCTNQAPWGCKWQPGDPCASNPCKNGGTCTTLADKSNYSCSCLPCYTGTTCETIKSDSGCKGGEGCTITPDGDNCVGKCEKCYTINPSTTNCEFCPGTKCASGQIKYCNGSSCECKKGFSDKVDIIGYIGSGGCCGDKSNCKVKPSWDKQDIPDYYNIVVLSFWGDSPSKLSVPEWLKTWRNGQDPWNRRRQILISLGGQGGTPTAIVTGLPGAIKACNEENGADGIDIDVEVAGVDFKQMAETLTNDLHKKDSNGLTKTVTLVPEFWGTYIGSPNGTYSPFLTDKSSFSWIAPQFYNNGVSDGGLPNNSPPPDPNAWFSEDIGYLMQSIKALKEQYGLDQSQVGLLTPVNTCGANDQNKPDEKIRWNMKKLATQIQKNNIKHIGCWDITYDRFMGDTVKGHSYPWAGSLAHHLLGTPDTPCKNCPFDTTLTGILKAPSAPNGAADPSCKRICSINLG